MIKKLTDCQHKAVEYCESPLLIVAGPGTGKTKVIVEKVVYLVNVKQYNPNKILVSTFTVKAAEKLKENLRKYLGNKVENMQISTIHSFCQTMLEEFSSYHRLGASFRVLDEEDQYLFVKSKYGYEFGLKDVVRPHQTPDLIDTFNKFSENNVKPEELQAFLLKQEISEREIKIIEAYDKYLTALKTENLVDFSILQKEFIYLLQTHKEVLYRVQDKFDYILIDEYQDTNPIQALIFKLIADPKYNITAVGDEDQSIYGFRGASVENFRNFPNVYPNVKTIPLEENFRSGKEIVSFSNNFMKSHRIYKKEIKAVRGETNKPILIRGTSSADEAKKVVKLIQQYKQSGFINSYGDVSILFRSVKKHSEYYVNYLKDEKIPYYVVGDGAFIEREEVRTILYIMALLESFSPDDNILDSWEWWDSSLLLNEVLDLSDNSKEKLSQVFLESNFIGKVSYDFLDSLKIDKKDIFLLLRLFERRKKILGQSEKRKKYSLTVLFYDILKTTGYLKRLIDLANQGDEESEIQIYNLGLLSSIIYKFETITNNNNFKHFFNHLYYLPDNKTYDCAYIEKEDAVKLMTVHQAKGLEFPVVILGSVTNKRFPSFAATMENNFFELPQEFLLTEPGYNPLDEERRLFYVGMTRAQDLLIIATTDGHYMKPSEYIVKDIGIVNFKRPSLDIKKCENIYEKDKEIPKLSYSAINNFLSCPFRYSLNYKYKFQTPPTYFQNYGVVVHNCLQKIHLEVQDGKKIDLKKIKEIVNVCWIPVLFDNKRDKKMKANLIELVWNYFRKTVINYKEIISVEKPFSLIGKNFVINGKVDLVVKNSNNELEILDFKSRNIEGIEETMVDLQLRMYNLALNQEYDIKGLYAYTFKDNMKVKFSNEKQDLEKTKQIIIDVGNKIYNEQFEKNFQSKFCKNCLYSFLCSH